jgi:ribosomal protein S18 acetylase RimI-like enzyme
MQFVDLDPGDPRLSTDAFPVLAELRSELTREEFAAVCAEGHAQGLRFTAAYDDHGRCVAVAGWRIVATTVAVRKLYVDDLVTASSARGQRIGSALLAELRARAREAGCRVIDLDSALHRGAAHRFYIREGMPIVGFHFAQTVR